MVNLSHLCLSTVFAIVLMAGMMQARAQDAPATPPPVADQPSASADSPALSIEAPPSALSSSVVTPVMPPAGQTANPPSAAAAAPSAAAAPLRSLVFTIGEQTAIDQAKSYRGMVRPPTEDELNKSLLPEGQRAKPPPEEREIRLGGIVYVDGKDWTIWLNGQRITPDAIPKQALDLKVHKYFIEIKWFDEYTNQIFPLRLRPHQRFNIDSRIFLPG